MVVDEAHLLGDPNRGPTFELLIASMLSLKNPPRIALLSATLGNPELLRKWLHPCQIVSSTLRTPLVKEVWQLEAGENPDEALSDALRRVLTEPSNAALVFVYRRDSAEALAHKLSIQLLEFRCLTTTLGYRRASERRSVPIFWLGDAGAWSPRQHSQWE